MKKKAKVNQGELKQNSVNFGELLAKALPESDYYESSHYFANLKLCNDLKVLKREEAVFRDDKKIHAGLKRLRKRIETGDSAALIILLLHLIDTVSWLENFSERKRTNVEKVAGSIPVWPILVAPKNLKDAKSYLKEIGVGIKTDFPHLGKKRGQALSNQYVMSFLTALEYFSAIDPCAGNMVRRQVFPDGQKLTRNQLKNWWEQKGRSIFTEFIKSSDNIQAIENYVNPGLKARFESESLSHFLSKCYRSFERILCSN